ncbi:MAG: TrkA family potassium uptake protein [Flavobacteriales bacterium]|nr:TrkA family potassium uptake protein [Flavobacteriales bacterium]
MKIAVFGLGNFGKHLSIKLTGMGHEVISIDHDMEKVEAIKSEVSYAVCLESNDPQAMSTLPLSDVDAAVVAIGENEGANIMTTALLVNLKVKRVISRAINPLHEMVLNSMGVTDIVHPRKAAEGLARKLNLRRLVDQFALPGGFIIAEIVVPDSSLARRSIALMSCVSGSWVWSPCCARRARRASWADVPSNSVRSASWIPISCPRRRHPRALRHQG